MDLTLLYRVGLVRLVHRVVHHSHLIGSSWGVYRFFFGFVVVSQRLPFFTPAAVVPRRSLGAEIPSHTAQRKIVD